MKGMEEREGKGKGRGLHHGCWGMDDPGYSVSFGKQQCVQSIRLK